MWWQQSARVKGGRRERGEGNPPIVTAFSPVRMCEKIECSTMITVNEILPWVRNCMTP
jgi:hypothetical protein